ncbi:putative chromatin binding protein [Trypanosoma theileri]|uniref:Putative chromatin binding protein n=1 Tax=Trypanosoma theileri TaxID=67003 RepID=A0A1X0NL15_9TRYP|nr:putative chromatin binding protein [Trypanosoma theileri]ORC85218.1 putative chromatin binding protein [Trypanosoma theileri]
MGPYVVLDVPVNTTSLCEKTTALLDTYTAEGDTLIKVVRCAKHYGAALFRTGRLVLLAPESEKKHGTKIESGDGIVCDVAAGDNHIVFCKDDGTVFSFGYSNKYGQLGDGTVWESYFLEKSSNSNDNDDDDDDELPILSPPRKINGFSLGKRGNEEGDVVEGKRICVPVIAVACGAFHTLLLTSQRNCVYGCGLGLEGQLGGSRRPLLQPSFKSIHLLFGLPIKQIVAAGKHSFVLLQTGKLFAFGDNTSGQLGFGSTHSVTTPTAVNFSVTGSNEKSKKKRIDASTLKGLRAAWGSAESMYFPLRVERLSPELDPDEPFIVSIWTCANRSVALANTMEWFSCGLPLSRAPCEKGGKILRKRMDSYGPLGRWMGRKEEAAFFGKMQWSERIALSLGISHFPLLSNDGVSFDEIIASIFVFCTNHAVFILIPKNEKENQTFLFVEGEAKNVYLVDKNGDQSPLEPTVLAEKLIYDHKVDDDSSEYILPEAHSIFLSERLLVAV